MAAVGGAASPRVWKRVVDDLRGLPGIEERRSQFADTPALWVDGHEFLHADLDGSIDVRLTRAEIRRRDDLGEDRRVYFRRSSSADWIQVFARADDDVPFLVELARAAAHANRRS
jgi:hypothetical protein